MDQQPEIVVLRVQDDSDFEEVFRIRREVFVKEQQVPEDEEFDGYDHISHHFLALYKGEPAGTARWRITPFGKIKLERFAVLEPFRGKGIGDALLQAVLGDLPNNFPIYLHAQVQVTGFYEKAGFHVEGEAFDECGIMHYKMVKG